MDERILTGIKTKH